MSRRMISTIAEEIRSDWGEPSATNSYLSAMMYLGSIDDQYYAMPARIVVASFLSNASTWRGETARRVKAELRSILKLPKWEHGSLIDA